MRPTIHIQICMRACGHGSSFETSVTRWWFRIDPPALAPGDMLFPKRRALCSACNRVRFAVYIFDLLSSSRRLPGDDVVNEASMVATVMSNIASTP